MILALFTGAGGRMILYRPGQPPVDAPSVPKVYQVMKSLGHSTMAVSEVVLPYVDNASDRQLAEVRAREVTGVFEVENSLTVERE